MDAPNDLNASDGFSDFKSDRIPIKRKSKRVTAIFTVLSKFLSFAWNVSCLSIRLYSILFRIRYKLPFVSILFRSNFISWSFFFFFRDQNYFFNNIRNTQKHLVIINLFSTNDSGWFNLKCIHASMKIILLIEIDIFLKFTIIFHSVNPDTKNKKSLLWVDILYEKKKNKNSEI